MTQYRGNIIRQCTKAQVEEMMTTQYKWQYYDLEVFVERKGGDLDVHEDDEDLDVEEDYEDDDDEDDGDHHCSKVFLERGGATAEGLADEATRVQVLKFCFVESQIYCCLSTYIYICICNICHI